MALWQAIQQFKAKLSTSEIAVLEQCLQEARQALPRDWMPWYLGPAKQATGFFKPHIAALIQSLDARWIRLPQGLHWDTAEATSESRSLALAHLADQLRSLGVITGWRDEKFSYWPVPLFESGGSEPLLQPSPEVAEDFQMERAAFRLFGLHSHAVHINGLTPNGDLWCGRRAMSKATDPGMLDNLAAGGLPAGETCASCAVRELAEEAGIDAMLAQTAVPMAGVTTCREVPEGWHYETLWVYNLLLPEGLTPVNQDGEVSEFMCLSPHEVVQAIADKHFTPDAACVIAWASLRP
jgi:8-oxo-dGTP pyrophosphatase MutT (NUDIX family)